MCECKKVEHPSLISISCFALVQIVLFETTNQQTNEEVTVKVIYKKKVKMSECVQFYNVLFNRIMRKLKMSKIGNNYYSPGGSVLIPQHK